jgi:hypothetical protein
MIVSYPTDDSVDLFGRQRASAQICAYASESNCPFYDAADEHDRSITCIGVGVTPKGPDHRAESGVSLHDGCLGAAEGARTTLAAERQVRVFLIGPRNRKQRKTRSTIKILHLLRVYSTPGDEVEHPGRGGRSAPSHGSADAQVRRSG